MVKKLNRKRNQKGLTLVELLVVIAIIGILAAIAIPQYNQYRNRGYIASLKSDAKNLYTAVQAWIADHPGGALVADTSTNGTAYGTYTSAGRSSPGNTVAVTAAGVVTAINATAANGSYVINADGTVADGLTPK
jgi:type IV pilus assembly protein PilA